MKLPDYQLRQLDQIRKEVDELHGADYQTVIAYLIRLYQEKFTEEEHENT